MAGKVLRPTVAIALTALVLYWSHPRHILAAAGGADWRWIVAALGLVLIDRSLMALRWIELLVALAPGSRPSLRVVLTIFFESSFVSNFVPSVASDMYRAYALSQYDVHLAESTASVLMDRALGVLSVVLVGGAALPFASDMAERGQLMLWLGVIFFVCAVAAAVVFSERAAGGVRSLASLMPAAILRRAGVTLTDAVRRYAGQHRVMAKVLVESIVVQVIRVLQAWCLARAIGIDLPLLAYFMFVPLIVLIMQIPVTINGIGTTQAAFAWLFVPQGGDPAAVFALSVLFLALGIVGTLPGGVLYALEPQGRARPAAHGPHATDRGPR